MNMEEDNLTSSLSGGSDGSTDGSEAVSNDSPKKEAVDAISLKELKDVLGKEFLTKDAALKAVKDTFSYVGKKETPKEVTKSSSSEIEELKSELFFTQNPDLKDTRPILEALAMKNSQSLREVAESDYFKDTLTKIKGFAENQEKRTVTEGGRRFDGGSEDTQKEFKEAIGNKEKMASFVLKHIVK
jgi:hypothetical protein